MPIKVGMRTIKTAISIFLCLAVFIILKFFELIPGVEENFAFIWYNPFFAGIATAYSVYPDKRRSVAQAKNRIVASLIGGIVGILLVVIYEFILQDPNAWPVLTESKPLEFIGPYILIAVFSILVVIVGLIIKQRPAVFVAILTFLSVTVNANGVIAANYGEWIFGINRIVSTIIGVLIALGVNLFQLPHFTKNKDLLFCIGIEGIIQTDTDKIKGFTNYKINSLVHHGVSCTLFTTRTPATFMHLFDDVEINHPVICMSGAALYDTKKLKYLDLETIPLTTACLVDKFLSSLNVTPFKNYIINDVLHIFCEKLDNIGENLYVNSMKNAPYCDVNITSVFPNQDILYYLIIENEDIASKIVMEIENGALNDRLIVQVYDVFEKDEKVANLKYIKIYSKEVLKLKVLKHYCEEKSLRPVGLVTSELSNHLLDNCVYQIGSSIKGGANQDLNVERNAYEKMFNGIQKMYYSKKYHE